MSVLGTTKHSSCNQCIGDTLGSKVILYRKVAGTLVLVLVY